MKMFKLKKTAGIFAAILVISINVCACALKDNTWQEPTTEAGGRVTESEPATAEHSGELKSTSRDIFAMDTFMTITCYGDRCEEAADAAAAEIMRLDELLSVGNPDSEISIINREGSGRLSQDSQAMLAEAMDVFDETDGAFDITVYPLMELWGFTSGEYEVPSEELLKQELEKVGSDKLIIDGDSIKLRPGQGIDLGGIAKGYASDRLMEIFAEYDLTSALISLGGNVQLYGTKPDGSMWRCGIQDPFNADEGSSIIGVLEAADCAVITSGGYERFFTDESGQTYHHILDPKTGYPADNGLVSVSIVSESGMLADTLSTACYVMGLERSTEYWRAHRTSFDMILVDEDGHIYITEGLKGRFSSDLDVEVIS